MDPIEEQIIQDLVSKAINANYIIAVTDGEEMVLEPSDDIDEVVGACGITDESFLYIYGMGYHLVGFMKFTHGKGKDVLTYHTDNTFFTWLTKDGYIQ